MPGSCNRNALLRLSCNRNVIKVGTEVVAYINAGICNRINSG